MAEPANKLEAKVLTLPREERARLAERLISILDSASDPDAEEAWIGEAERRLDEIEAGTAEIIPGEQAIEKARASLR